ncbi:MAG: COX15/CtaA family protein [Candidatus Schekmanbacteria bacterium]|nr:COX15/CtaA family protein [Candidatus Schekmanbacteria bacterium]
MATSRRDGAAQDRPAAGNRAVGLWLLGCCALLLGMVVLGGVTRLTGSGLAIVHWQPVVGVVPPLSAEAWAQEFAHYRQSPEFLMVRSGMSLAAFRSIYLVEYAHRLAGRLLGLAFLLPAAYFLARRQIDRPLLRHLVAIFSLGGLQGALGWYMVQSGLVDVPRVSPYRLTAHLLVAMAIYAYMFWTGLGVLLGGARASPSAPRGLARMSRALLLLIAITIASGGFVAGTKSGHAFPTFPLMQGELIPSGYWTARPWHANFFENIVTVQFNHRLLATVVLLATAALCAHGLRHIAFGPLRRGLVAVAAAACLQVGLGIATVLFHVPVGLAVAHQGSAVLLLSAALYVNNRLTYG